MLSVIHVVCVVCVGAYLGVGATVGGSVLAESVARASPRHPSHRAHVQRLLKEREQAERKQLENGTLFRTQNKVWLHAHVHTQVNL